MPEQDEKFEAWLGRLEIAGIGVYGVSGKITRDAARLIRAYRAERALKRKNESFGLITDLRLQHESTAEVERIEKECVG